MKLTVTKSFTSASSQKILNNQVVATEIKLGRKTYALDRTATAEIVDLITKAKKLEVAVEDLRSIARYFVHRQVKNEYGRAKCDGKGYGAWFTKKNPTKSFEAHKAGFTRRANIARQAYADIVAFGIAKFA